MQKKSRISKVKNCIQPLIYMACIDIQVMIECSQRWNKTSVDWIRLDWIVWCIDLEHWMLWELLICYGQWAERWLFNFKLNLCTLFDGICFIWSTLETRFKCSAQPTLSSCKGLHFSVNNPIECRSQYIPTHSLCRRRL